VDHLAPGRAGIHQMRDDLDQTEEVSRSVVVPCCSNPFPQQQENQEEPGFARYRQRR
jgi:hypothetical protein